MFKTFHKSREYPLIRDEYGRSARQQAFELFIGGYRPSQIFKEGLIPVSIKTLLRYFEDWKKQKHRVSRLLIRRIMKMSLGPTYENVRLGRIPHLKFGGINLVLKKPLLAMLEGKSVYQLSNNGGNVDLKAKNVIYCQHSVNKGHKLSLKEHFLAELGHSRRN